MIEEWSLQKAHRTVGEDLNGKLEPAKEEATLPCFEISEATY